MSAIRQTTNKSLMLFSGRAYPELTTEIAGHLGVTPTPTASYEFANGELFVRFEESVRGCDAFVVQSHTAPINTWLMEQLIMVDALKRASAKRITVVAPFFPYARQDKKHRGREPISARLVADLFRTAGANPDAARYAGMRPRFLIVLAMATAGLLAGLAGAVELLGVTQRMTASYGTTVGFDSIAVALLGRANPIGIVFAVMPWNFPIWQALRAAVPIMLAGNGFVLKHADNVQGCAALLADTAVAAGMPVGAFTNVAITQEASIGVVGDPRIAAVTVTAGPAAGEAIAAEAGRHLKKSVLELGGVDPFIVLADADLDAVASYLPGLR